MNKTCYPENPDLKVQLLLECEAMAKYAFASGFQVPTTIIQILSPLLNPLSIAKTATAECNGSLFEKKAGFESVSLSMPELALAHNKLAALVKPATPRALLYLEKQCVKNAFWNSLFPVPLIRKIMLLMILSLAGLLALSLFPEVDGQVSWATESGITLLLEELFLLFAAAVGASFSALFELNGYLTRGTYDPTHDTSYWVNFVLGLVSGMILALLIPLETSSSAAGEFTKPLLAMVGGFSAGVLNRILKRIVVAIESLVRGDPREAIDTEVRMLRINSEQEQTQSRLKLATDLIQIKNQLGPDVNPELQNKMNEILKELMGAIPKKSPDEEPQKSDGSSPRPEA